MSTGTFFFFFFVWCKPLPLCVPPSPEEGEYFLKVLIPSYAAGSIIGKGGQTIVQLQKETGATIKLSKSKDFYPGKTTPTPLTNTECVCMRRRPREAQIFLLLSAFSVSKRKRQQKDPDR